MEVHQHFMNIAEIQSSIFEMMGNLSILQESIGPIVVNSIENNFQNLRNSEDCRKPLESMRLLLCQLYKLKFEYTDMIKLKLRLKFNEHIEILNANKCNAKQYQSIVYDILTLHLIVLEDQKNFVSVLEDFRTLYNDIQSMFTNKLSTDRYLKILRCFLTAWEVLYFLNNRQQSAVINKAHLESCRKVLLSTVMYDLQTWIYCKENEEWQALQSVLSRVVHIAKSNRILIPYAHEILDRDFDLTFICVICDFVFPIHSGADVDYSLIYHENLWIKIQSNLASCNLQNRKKALFLFKRLMDFIDENEENIKRSDSLSLIKDRINPFICNKKSATDIRQIRNNFIIIIEVLEEKQKHLVIPSLSLLDTLILGTVEHKSCGNCFDSSWVYCVISRLLDHDNNAVVKWAVMKLLRLNVGSFNVFITPLIEALNNTFLYEKFGNQDEPEIVIALIDWFKNLQIENHHFIEKFIHVICQVQWGPVPIFYVMQALYSSLGILHCVTVLQEEQIRTLGSLLKTNIILHPPMIRSMTLVRLIQILSTTSIVEDVKCLLDFLTIIPENDIREPMCWSALKNWFKRIYCDVVVTFIKHFCQTLKVDDDNITISTSSFALMIQLLYESGSICKTDQCAIGQELSSLLLCLDKIDVRPYVKISLVSKLTDFICSFFELQRPLPEFIHQICLNYKETIFKFILKLFHNQSLDYDHAKIFAKLLQSTNYCISDKVYDVSIITSNGRKELERKCIEVLNSASEHNTAQVLFALQSWSKISQNFKYEDKFFLEIIEKLMMLAKSAEHASELTGKRGLDYCVALSVLVRNHVLSLHIDDMKKNGEWLLVVSDVLDATGNEVLVNFAEVIKHYWLAVADDNKKLEDLRSLVRSFWSCNFGSKRERIFWLVAQKLTECINSSEFLSCKSLQDISQEFTQRMLDEGESLAGLNYVLLTYSNTRSHFDFFMEMILSGLLHGQVMRRDQRIHMQSLHKVQEILSFYNVEHERIKTFVAYDYLNRQCNVDANVRAAAVVQLCNALCENRENATSFLPLVLKKLLALRNKRYFADSQIHRLKHRLMQTLLILQPHLNKESTQILYHALRDLIIHESEQHSVRLMKEWLLVKIYLDNEDLISDLWLFFDKVCEERPGSTNSIIGVVWHIAQHTSTDDLEEFINEALKRLAVCSMGQQFGMRLFGQVFFVKLYELLDTKSSVRSEYLSLYEAILKSLNCGNFKKNPIKIDEDFFYASFDILEHYSLETIYHQLPRLSNISMEEWIMQENFEDQIFLNNSTMHIKVSNYDSLLDKAEIPYSILKSNESSKPEEIECSQVTDIQKKITPWKAMIPNEEELINLSDIQIATTKKQEIIVVASLIEKPQNLGGIARTSEIFGVKELVITNLKQIEDKEFQVLSVSADRWIKVSEVKSFLLTKYLMEMKECGWTLVGAEQTANSVNLFDFKFPEQTLLILGNEKNGIPANIIPLLDVCVEIPQYGVIRSLNVHVTSAICIWEYTKQHQLLP